MTPQDEFKQKAAVFAADLVESGMVVGLGTGSTTHFALLRLGELIRSGRLRNVVGIPSSLRTETAARELGIPLADFERHPVIDVTIDGAPGKKYSGVVSSISPKAEFTPKTVETYRERVTMVYRVRIKVPNPQRVLKVGMPAEAVISLAKP